MAISPEKVSDSANNASNDNPNKLSFSERISLLKDFIVRPRLKKEDNPKKYDPLKAVTLPAALLLSLMSREVGGMVINAQTLPKLEAYVVCGVVHGAGSSPGDKHRDILLRFTNISNEDYSISIVARNSTGSAAKPLLVFIQTMNMGEKAVYHEMRAVFGSSQDINQREGYQVVVLASSNSRMTDYLNDPVIASAEVKPGCDS